MSEEGDLLQRVMALELETIEMRAWKQKAEHRMDKQDDRFRWLMRNLKATGKTVQDLQDRFEEFVKTWSLKNIMDRALVLFQLVVAIGTLWVMVNHLGH